MTRKWLKKWSWLVGLVVVICGLTWFYFRATPARSTLAPVVLNFPPGTVWTPDGQGGYVGTAPDGIKFVFTPTKGLPRAPAIEHKPKGGS